MRLFLICFFIFIGLYLILDDSVESDTIDEAASEETYEAGIHHQSTEDETDEDDDSDVIEEASDETTESYNYSQPEPIYEASKSPKKEIVPEDSYERSSNHTTASHAYIWKNNYNSNNCLKNRISPPQNFHRTNFSPGSFAEWLRGLPLKDGHPEVLLYNGAKKGNQSAQFAVVDIDTGKEDLQQCADAVMRLRAEYLYANNKVNLIHFNFTSGHNAQWAKWKEGYRPVINGNNVSWVKKAQADASYDNFKKYLRIVFMYAGTHSLSKELTPVNIKDIQPGDVFIQGGFPGHAVIVTDVAVNSETGEKVFMLAQSYMPAQDIHILKNPSNSRLSPWYSVEELDKEFDTPEWSFNMRDLKRFREL